MKKNVIFAGVFFVVFIATLSCDKRSVEGVGGFENFKIPAILNGAKFGGLQLPDGTTTHIENGGSTVRFEYPKGIKYFKKDSRGNIIGDSGGSYTCTGGCVKGCDVFYVGGSFACSQCEPSSISCVGKSNPQNRVVDSDEAEGAFVNLNQKIAFVSDEDEIGKMKPAPSFLFDIPEVRDEVLAFNRKVYGVDRPEVSWENKKDFKVVVVNFFGSAVRYLIPASYHSKLTNARISTVSGSKIACTCQDAQSAGGCKDKSMMTYSK